MRLGNINKLFKTMNNNELIEYISSQRNWDEINKYNLQTDSNVIEAEFTLNISKYESMVMTISEKRLEVWSDEYIDANVVYLNKIQQPTKEIVDILLENYFKK
jgi:hypothetical protein